MPTILTPEQAHQRGYEPITTPYKESEKTMLERAIADQKGCDFVLVEVPYGTEIWRNRMELRHVTKHDLRG